MKPEHLTKIQQARALVEEAVSLLYGVKNEMDAGRARLRIEGAGDDAYELMSEIDGILDEG